MDKTKDYYAILGVLPTAEDVVIRAAYKALAQRYHPDRTRETGPDASKRMALINEAYAVLSDPDKRKEYDALRGKNTQSGDSYFDEDDEDVPPSFDPLEKDWNLAVTYYPDLPELEARLARIAWRLAYSFRAYMLAEKAFEKRALVAAAMEQKFLEMYFGTNPEILDFARSLINGGHKQAAKELNEAIRILGKEADADRLINQIKKAHFPQPEKTASKTETPKYDNVYVSPAPNASAGYNANEGEVKGGLWLIVGLYTLGLSLLIYNAVLVNKTESVVPDDSTTHTQSEHEHTETLAINVDEQNKVWDEFLAKYSKRHPLGVVDLRNIETVKAGNYEVEPETEGAVSRFGHLRAERVTAHQGEPFTAFYLNDKLIHRRDLDEHVSVYAVFNGDSQDIVIYAAQCPGTACPSYAKFIILTLKSNHDIKIIENKDLEAVFTGPVSVVQIESKLFFELGYVDKKIKRATFENGEVLIKYYEPIKIAPLDVSYCDWGYENTLDGCINQNPNCDKAGDNLGSVFGVWLYSPNHPEFNRSGKFDDTCRRACMTQSKPSLASFRKHFCYIRDEWN